jgi:hypothetical protein
MMVGGMKKEGYGRKECRKKGRRNTGTERLKERKGE